MNENRKLRDFHNKYEDKIYKEFYAKAMKIYPKQLVYDFSASKQKQKYAKSHKGIYNLFHKVTNKYVTIHEKEVKKR